MYFNLNRGCKGENMSTENTLIALAYVKESNNPLEVFCNYIWISLLEAPKNQQRYDEIYNEMEERFGLKMPHHMIKMCCKVLEKQGKVKKLPKGAGFKCCDFSFDLNAYNNKRKELSYKENHLLNGLLTLAEDYNLNWDYEHAKECMTDFLLVKGNAVSLFTQKSIRQVDSGKYMPDEWYVGKYISRVLERNDDRTEYLLDIVNGLMIYIGIYETSDYYQDYTQKFRGTDFYMDTKLLLRFMGFSWQLEIDAVKELVDLIRNEYGGNICVFEHTVGEVEAALYNASGCIERGEVIQDTELRMYVELNKCDAYDLKLYSQSVVSKINKMGFRIKSPIDWNSADNQAHNLDWEQLQEYIKRKHPNWKDIAIANDVMTINYINILRKGNYTIKFGGVKKLPVFITSNVPLVWNIREYITDFGESDKGIAFWKVNALPIITDNMLMCRLWLPKAQIKSSIPTMTLARNAYAAQQVNGDFFEKIRISAHALKDKHQVDMIDVSLARKEKIEEVIIKNIAGELDEISPEILASSVDEVISLETVDLKETIEELEQEKEKHILEIQRGNENIVRSAAERYKGRLRKGNILIYLAEYYWIIVAIIFSLLSIGISQIKGLSISNIIPHFYFFGLYVVLTIINKVAEKALNKASVGEKLMKYTVKFLYGRYKTIIHDGLMDFEKDLESQILNVCIEKNTLLSKYKSYCLG